MEKKKKIRLEKMIHATRKFKLLIENLLRVDHFDESLVHLLPAIKHKKYCLFYFQNLTNEIFEENTNKRSLFHIQ